MKKFWVLLLLSVAGFGQTAPTQGTAVKLHRPVAAKSAVDSVIDLVKGGMSEALVIKQLQREGKSYELTTPDLVKLQKAGVSENIINVMLDPKAAVALPGPSPATSNPLASKDSVTGGAPPAPPPPANADIPAITADTPPPPDLPNAPAVRKRRVVIASFQFGALRDPAQISPAYSANPWIAILQARNAATAGATVPSTTDDIGKGLQGMIMNRLQQSHVVTVLERNAAIDEELKRGVSAQTSPGSRPALGRSLGADCIVTGDITIFGRDDKTTKKGGILAGLIPGKAAGITGFGVTRKEEKAVVGLELRLVDAETSEVLLPIHARGESKRMSKTLGLEGLGLGAGGGAGGGFQSAMNNSNFANTILGEATINAVDQIVKQIQEKIPQLPAKPRKIEGRVASITPNGIYLALGSQDGVVPGDRFEIRQINNQVLDPQTKDPIATEAVKVGELVVSEVDEKSSIGNYGGHPLSPDYITGKGYQARLISK
jgi:curli biogenesis system outer membrane secretion channel CsgG